MFAAYTNDMKRATVLLTLIGLLIIGHGCVGGTDEADKKPVVVDTKALPSPGHVVSPLAQLMRDMTAFADSTKQRLLRGEDLPPYPADFKTMLTVESTPGMVDHRTYDPFAFSYLHQLDSLYKVPAHQRQQAYDELIQYCTACHGQVCPGPLVRIKKLRMPDTL